MPEDVHIPFTNLFIGRFLFLMIAILLMFALRPFLQGFVGSGLLMDIFVSIIFLSGIHAVSPKKPVFYISLSIATPALVVLWASHVFTVPASLMVKNFFGGLFFAFMVIVILNYIFKEKQISTDVIIGAICAYLLLGLAWASIFAILEDLQPGSFRTPGDLGTDLSNFSYYSFVTITTLGYGDITPITAPARSLSILEAVMGQLYLAVLVARLVGIHIAQSMD